MRARSFFLLAFLAAPASAAETVPVGDFRQLELRGGGEVVVRHGAAPRVTILEGSRAVSSFDLDEERRLVIRACRERCPRGYRLRVEIVSPRVEALAVTGGGAIRTIGAFPRKSDLALAVTGGGTIDARQAQAGSVAAAVTGGGTINTHPLASLAAAVRGGGVVRYWGNPSVTQAVRGGGAVQRVGR
jgi:hypothetical protein